MSKLPAIMFYPGDWRKDPAVQSLNYEERGMWFEILLFMNEANERGKILIEDIENMLGIDQAKSSKLVAKLSSKGVAKIEQNFIVCRRMIKEQKIKEIRRYYGSIGGSKRQANLKQNFQAKSSLSSSSSSSSSSSLKERINKKEKYGFYSHVFLTPKEYQKLKEKLGEEKTQQWIKNLDEGIELKGYKYKSHYMAILKWIEKEKTKEKPVYQPGYIDRPFTPPPAEREERAEMPPEFKEKLAEMIKKIGGD